MLTKNIRLKGFGITKNKKKIALQVSKKLNFYKKSRLINSFSENYCFDFNNNSVNKFKKYTNFNLIGMGGSSLSASLNDKNSKVSPYTSYSSMLTTVS